MTINRDALEKSAEEKLRTIGAIHEAKSTDVIKGAWVNAPLTIVLDAILPDVQADAWDEGWTASESYDGHHAVPTNPYRTVASE